MSNPTYALTRYWSYLEGVAVARLEAGAGPRQDATADNNYHLMGAAVELAARLYLGLGEELPIGPDGGVDFRVGPLGVDCKATPYKRFIDNLNLQIRYDKLNYNAGVYLLGAVVLDAHIVNLLGYATRGEILSAPINYSRPIACYEIPIPRLRPVQELLSYARANQEDQSDTGGNQYLIPGRD